MIPPYAMACLITPTWGPPAVVWLKKTTEGKFAYNIRQTNGSAGYYTEEVVLRADGETSSSQTEQLESLFSQFDPLSPDTPIEAPPKLYTCFDGTRVIFEINQAGAYKLIDRHNCDLSADAPFRKLTHLLNDLSGGLLFYPYQFEYYEFDPLSSSGAGPAAGTISFSGSREIGEIIFEPK